MKSLLQKRIILKKTIILSFEAQLCWSISSFRGLNDRFLLYQEVIEEGLFGCHEVIIRSRKRPSKQIGYYIVVLKMVRSGFIKICPLYFDSEDSPKTSEIFSFLDVNVPKIWENHRHILEKLLKFWVQSFRDGYLNPRCWLPMLVSLNF